MIGAVTISNGALDTLIGCFATAILLMIGAFATFFLRRLVDQLDKVSASLTEQAKFIAVINSRLEAIEHKTKVVAVTDDSFERTLVMKGKDVSGSSTNVSGDTETESEV